MCGKKSLFWREIKILKKKIISTVFATDNNEEILNLLKEKFNDNDRDIEKENNFKNLRGTQFLH